MKSRSSTDACSSTEDEIARRNFLGSLVVGGAAVSGLGAFVDPLAASQLASQQKRMLVIRMKGGLSQLESWAPKPGTDTGGPGNLDTCDTFKYLGEILVRQLADVFCNNDFDQFVRTSLLINGPGQ